MRLLLQLKLHTLPFLPIVVVRPVILHYNLTSRFGQFLQTLPITNEHYKPTFWCFESRIQTIFASILRRTIPQIKYKREVINNYILTQDWIFWMLTYLFYCFVLLWTFIVILVAVIDFFFIERWVLYDYRIVDFICSHQRICSIFWNDWGLSIST